MTFFCLFSMKSITHQYKEYIEKVRLMKPFKCPLHMYVHTHYDSLIDPNLLQFIESLKKWVWVCGCDGVLYSFLATTHPTTSSRMISSTISSSTHLEGEDGCKFGYHTYIVFRPSSTTTP
jgi:hypothetical protein